MTQTLRDPNIAVATWTPGSYVDGPGGPRAVVWFSGCQRAVDGDPCPGCQNPKLWERDWGSSVKASVMAHHLTRNGRPVTISGGEPFDQADGLYWLIRHIKIWKPATPILVYTGYIWEELAAMGREVVQLALPEIDILVDGRYDPGLDDDFVQWRGSSNQRLIRSSVSIDAGAIQDPANLVLADWDTAQEIQVTESGKAVMTKGMADELSWASVDELGDPMPDMGAVQEIIARCGQAEDRPGDTDLDRAVADLAFITGQCADWLTEREVEQLRDVAAKVERMASV